MQLDEVKSLLSSENPQKRMSAITALRQYEDNIAVPLLAGQMNDPELIVRSFAVMGLGHKRSPEGFKTLVDVLQDEGDPNVRSEAANSLSKYGPDSLPFLLSAAEADDHWLLQLSILPLVAELNAPNELYRLCNRALEHPDPVVQSVGLEHLGYLSHSVRHDDALEILLIWAESEDWLLRKQAALTLRKFSGLFAQKAIMRLREDEDYRVVAATLEGLMS
jgi:HEAT repeat protein